MCFSYECWQQHFWLRSVPFTNAIAVPMPGLVTSSQELVTNRKAAVTKSFEKVFNRMRAETWQLSYYDVTRL
jgi:hypothetical protein